MCCMQRREVLEVRCLPPPLGRTLTADERGDLEASVAALYRMQVMIENELSEFEREIARLERELELVEVAAMPNPYAGRCGPRPGVR